MLCSLEYAHVCLTLQYLGVSFIKGENRDPERWSDIPESQTVNGRGEACPLSFQGWADVTPYCDLRSILVKGHLQP